MLRRTASAVPEALEIFFLHSRRAASSAAVCKNSVQAASARGCQPDTFLRKDAAQACRGFAAGASTPSGSQLNHVAVYGGIGLGVLGLGYLLLGGSPQKAQETAQAAAAKTASVAQTVGKGLAIPSGSPTAEQHVPDFELMDQGGQRVTADDILDNFALVVFGSLSGPGAEEHVGRLAEITRQSDRKSNMQYMRPVYVTMTGEHADKLHEFSEQHKKLFDSRKNHDGQFFICVAGEDSGKLLDAAKHHTTEKQVGNVKEHAVAFLINPDGQFVAAYGDDMPLNKIGEDIATHIGDYNHANPSWAGPKAVKIRHA